MCLSLTSFTSVTSEGTGRILNVGSPAFVVSPTSICLFVPYFISKLFIRGLDFVVASVYSNS